MLKYMRQCRLSQEMVHTAQNIMLSHKNCLSIHLCTRPAKILVLNNGAKKGNTFHYSKRKQDKHLRLIMCTVFGLAASLLAKNIPFFLSMFLLPATPLSCFFNLFQTHSPSEKERRDPFIHIVWSRRLNRLRGQEMCHYLYVFFSLCLLVFTSTEVSTHLHASY